jgi:tRNA threonylcarbamoyladenosine biosynthesis protein TsaE
MPAPSTGSGPVAPPPPAERRTTTAAPGETEALAAALGRALQSGGGGFVVALEGDLGAGKTVFVRGLARGLGLGPGQAVTSPTFTIAQSFALPGGLELHHVDAYRLRGPDDLELAGFEDACGNGKVTCVEWAGRVAGALPSDRLEVSLVPLPVGPRGSSADGPGEGRAITVRALGPRSARVLHAWLPLPPRVRA